MKHHNNNRHNPHIGSLTCGVWIIMVEKSNWKLLKLPQRRKRVNQSTMASLEVLQRLVPPSRTWRMPEWGFSPHFHLTYLFGLWSKQMDLGKWQWIILNLTRSWLQSHVPDVVLLLEQINIPRSLVCRYWAGKCFFPIRVLKTTSAICFQLARPEIHLLCGPYGFINFQALHHSLVLSGLVHLSLP